MSLKSGIIGSWKFDGNSNDSFGSNNGTNTNVLFVPGKINQAASFNGVNSVTLINNPIALEGSISLWSYHNDTSLVCRMFADEGGTSYFETNTFGGSANMFFWMYTGAVGINVSTSFIDNQWIHWVVTWKNGGSIYLYKNGVQVSTTPSPVLVISGTPKASFGSVTGIRYYSGLIDEANVWGRQISSAEVLSLYNNGNGLTYPFNNSSNFFQFL